jgi:hypothetical protein
MKATKSLLALAVLAAAGSANATAIATYNVSNAVTITGLASGSFTETGTAVLDSAGTLTIDKTGLNSTNNGNFTLTSQIVWSGTVVGNSFNVTSGTVKNVSCTAGTSACSTNLNLGVTTALSVTPASGNGGGLPTPSAFNIANGGAYNSDVYGFNHLLHTASVTTFTNNAPPAVPVPAAAWLFGSGLLGLAGTARRRRAAATAA